MAEELLKVLVRDRNRQRQLGETKSPDWLGPVGSELVAIAQGRVPSVGGDRSVGGTPLRSLEGLVTPKVAAAETGRSEQWITRLARRGAIVARKHGRSWLIDLGSAVGKLGRGGTDDGRADHAG